MLQRCSRASARAVGVCLCSLFALASAHADPAPALDRFSLWIGGYDTDTNIGIKDTENNEGDITHAKLKLGSGDTTPPRVRMDVLIGDSQGLSLDYFGIDRYHLRSLKSPLTVDGYTLDPSSDISSTFDLQIGTVAYRWWIGHGNDVFGFGVGAAHYHADGGLNALGTIEGQGFEAEYSYSEDFTAPLVTLGWRHAFGDSLRAYADISGIQKEGGELTGHIYNGALGVEWSPLGNVGIALEYALTRISLNQDTTSDATSLHINLNGPAAYVHLRF